LLQRALFELYVADQGFNARGRAKMMGELLGEEN
jgi:hypothetical protein